MQHTVIHCDTGLGVADVGDRRFGCNSLQHIAAHCNSQQLTATQVWSSPMEGIGDSDATHCNSPQLTATHCNTLQHAATNFSKTLQHTAPLCTTGLGVADGGDR